jgi:hypothetical protein
MDGDLKFMEDLDELDLDEADEFQHIGLMKN